MFDGDLRECGEAAVLAALRPAQGTIDAGETQLLRLAARWADLHAVVEPGSASVLLGGESLLRLGGAGTPAVAEFALAELGVELRTSTHQAGLLIADALDLRHRLPVLWARVRAGEVRPWIARKAAQATRHLTLDLALVLDPMIARWADRLPLGRLESMIEATWKRLDPDAAETAEREARDELGVWLHPKAEHGTQTLFARLEALDAAKVDAAVQRGADALRSLGDHRDLGRRRAAALGVLADPQDALDLHAAHVALAEQAGTADANPFPPEELDESGLPRNQADDEPPATVAGQPIVGGLPPSAWRRSRRVDTRPDATLYLHLTDHTLREGTGVVDVEGIGALTAGLVRDWLRDAHVLVRPVIDLHRAPVLDGHDIPDRLAEAVRLRSPLDCFPYATSTSRRMDLDHTEPYRSPDEGEPPGQTRTGNLAPLTRAHHRVKTHARGWAVRQPFDGVLVWRTPHGHYYLVDHTGTSKAVPAA